MTEPLFAMSKSTPDGVFKVSIISDGFAPEHEDKEIPGESLRQLVQLLEGLAQTVQVAYDLRLAREQRPDVAETD